MKSEIVASQGERLKIERKFAEIRRFYWLREVYWWWFAEMDVRFTMTAIACKL